MAQTKFRVEQLNDELREQISKGVAGFHLAHRLLEAIRVKGLLTEREIEELVRLAAEDAGDDVDPGGAIR